MKYWLLFFCLFSFFTMEGQERVPGEILFHSRVENPSLYQQMVTRGIEIETLSKRLGIYKVTFDERKFYAEKILANIKSDQDVIQAQFNHRISYRELIPNDPDFVLQENNLERIQLTKAWDLSTGGTNTQGDSIVIAILDSGCDIFHEDLAQNIWTNQEEIPNDGIDNDNNGYIDDFYGWNYFSQNDDHLANLNGSRHGTKVAGIIGAKGDNDTGISGVNWSVKLMNLSSAATEAEVVQAYSYVLDMRIKYEETNGAEGAYIVATNASFGVNFGQAADFPLWCGVYDSLGEAGILSVAAVINSPVDIDEEGDMPTSCASDYLITVTNINEQDELIAAGWGLESVDLAAPGQGVFTTDIQNGYASFGSTSGATPLVTGTIGLIYSLPCENLTNLAKEDPAKTALEIKEILLLSSQKFPALENRIKTEGMLDSYQTLYEIQERFCFQFDEELSLSKLYPNPLYGDILNLELNIPEIEQFDIFIYNSLGQKMMQLTEFPKENPRHLIQIPAGNLSAGIYFLKINNQKKDKAVFKFVVF